MSINVCRNVLNVYGNTQVMLLRLWFYLLSFWVSLTDNTKVISRLSYLFLGVNFYILNPDYDEISDGGPYLNHQFLQADVLYSKCFK